MALPGRRRVPRDRRLGGPLLARRIALSTASTAGLSRHGTQARPQVRPVDFEQFEQRFNEIRRLDLRPGHVAPHVERELVDDLFEPRVRRVWRAHCNRAKSSTSKVQRARKGCSNARAGQRGAWRGQLGSALRIVNADA